MHGRLFDLALVAPDPLRPAMLAGPPEVDAHQGAAHSACVLFGSYGCHPRFQSRRCSSAGCVLSAAHFSTRTSWIQPVASREKYMCGRYRLAPRVRPSRLPRPQGTGSCGPLRCREPPRFVPAPPVAPACAREEPSVLLLDSSGAIGGVLELPGDDYFISTAAEGRAGCIPARSNRFVSAYRAPHVVCDKQRQYHIKRTVKGRII